MSDSTCRFCGAPVRWVDDDGRRLILDVSPVADGGSYAVAGAESARRIRKADRPKYARLYRPHMETCPRADDAKAFIARQKTDREEARRIAQQLRHERETLPDNVVLMRNRRRSNG